MNRAKTILLLLTSLIALNLSANNYVKDLLIFEADTLTINQSILDTTIGELIKTNSINLDECKYLNCLDGYRVWELRNDSLFLSELRNCCGNGLLNMDSVNLLKEEFRQDEVFANWRSDTLYNQHGQLIKNVSSRLIYEYDREFIIENGLLKEIKNYDNRKSQESIYSEHPKKLTEFWFETINWEIIEKCNSEKKKRIILRFEADENGNAINIEVPRGVNEDCDEEIVNALKKLPGWDRYYVKGKMLPLKWNLPVMLDKNWYIERIND